MACGLSEIQILDLVPYEGRKSAFQVQEDGYTQGADFSKEPRWCGWMGNPAIRPMDEHGSRVLLAAVIEQAVHDRRKSITRGLIDEEARVPGHCWAQKRLSEIGPALPISFFTKEGWNTLTLAVRNLDAGEIRRARKT